MGWSKDHSMDKDDSTIQEESKEDISGFADQLASCLLKETIQEKGTGGEQEGEWAIPCSSVCHQHNHPKESDVSGANVKSGEAKSGSGQLCWTPESGDSLVTSAVTSCSEERMVMEENLRKGASVPNVSEENAGEDIDIDRVSCNSENSKSHRHRHRGMFFSFGLKSKPKSDTHSADAGQHRPKIKNIKKTLSSLFTPKSRAEGTSSDSTTETSKKSSNLFKLPVMRNKSKSSDPCQRALPPVPPPRVDIPDPEDIQIHIDDGGRLSVSGHEHDEVTPQHSPSQSTPRSDSDLDNLDFAASIERVKDRGWYWGPLSGEAAEKILSGEPDGSFVVRDSSDHHYIFSLTFKLNGFVRHVRIEHDQGNFSFGSFTRFKSTTIVDFIENAVEHSRSGRYLFFLHRRPVLGPMRVQLLHPVSRFKRVQSLQHLCRYVIVKVVRKDHLDQLPVPNRMKKYLNTPFYYSEQVTGNEEPVESFPQTLEQIEENVTNWDAVDEDEHEVAAEENDHQAEQGEEQM